MIKLQLNKSDKYLIKNILDNKIYNKYISSHILLSQYNESKYLIYIYDYILTSPKTIFYFNEEIPQNITNHIITKYRPLTKNFYIYNEIFHKFNILDLINKNTIITSIENSCSFIEILLYNKPELIKSQQIKSYRINNSINNLKQQYSLKEFEYINEKYNKLYKNIITIFSNIIEINLNIYDLPTYIFSNSDILLFNLFDITLRRSGIMNVDEQPNIINVFIGMIVALKYLNKGGTFILHGINVIYKQFADIYLILSKYFEESHLYYPECSNNFTRSGVYFIFKKFKGISKDKLIEFNNILIKLKTKIGDINKHFNIYSELIRTQYLIFKPITQHIPFITGFLNTKSNDIIYENIKNFNTLIYSKKNIFVNKLLKIISENDNNLPKIPTNEQLINSILYCKQYNIDYFDQYNTLSFKNQIEHKILSDMYGNFEPINYKFNTYYQQKTSDKLFIEPIFTKKTLNSNDTNIKNTLFNNKYLHKLSKKTKKNNNSDTIKLLTLQPTNNNFYKLMNNINNRILQADLLIDSRKNFKYDPSEEYEHGRSKQNEFWYNILEQLSYYGGKQYKNIDKLSVRVQKIVGDNAISQAWLKMYEIIEECNIINKKTGIYRTFHICEFPGTFINCLNYYIKTKTKLDKLEWHGQSLHPKLGGLSDKYGLYKYNKDRWDYGIDNTGDITNINNIKYYTKYTKDKYSIDLITSDCGIAKEDNYDYYKIALSSLIAMIYLLPISGSMIYKVLAPINCKLIINIIFICFQSFRDMHFFKPVQNIQSMEFYIICKGFNGIEQKNLDKLLNIIDNYSSIDGEKKYNKDSDIFNGIYTNIFIEQFMNIYEQFADNFCTSRERIIFYMDKYDKISDNFIRLNEEYINDKNNQWINKYKLQKINKNLLLIKK